MRRVLLILSSTLLLLWACNRADADLPPAYRDVQVPRARLASREARERGHELFLANCALCHGVRADGQGVRREGLSSPPRNFTDAEWRRRTSPRRIFFTIREGEEGTSMAAWRSLSDDQCWDLVAYLLSVSEGST